MSRQKFRLELTPDELAELKSFLKIKGLPYSPEKQRVRRRAQALWFSAVEGWSIKEITDWLNTTERSVWRWIKIYRQKGLAGLINPFS